MSEQINIYPEKYLDMDMRSLLHQMSYNNSLQHILNTASAMMDMPLLMLDYYHHCIAYSQGIYAPDEIITQTITAHGDLYSLLNRTLKADFFCVDPKGSGRLYCISQAEHLSPKQKNLLPLLTWLLFTVYNRTVEQGLLFKSEESMLLLRALKREDNEDDDIVRLEQHSNRYISAPWQILVFYLISDEIATGLFHKISTLLQTPYICSVSDKYLVALTHKLTDDAQKIMDANFKELSLRSGISYAFFDMNKIKHYLHQAIAALEESTLIKTDYGLVFYEKYLLNDLLYHLPDSILPYNLQHPVLKILRNESPHLYRTLQIYIQEKGSITKASALLHQHKNSVHYQLKQISDKAGYDVTTAESIASLRYAFAIDEFLTVHTN